MIPSVVGHFRRLRRLSKSGHWRQTSLSPLSLSLLFRSSEKGTTQFFKHRPGSYRSAAHPKYRSTLLRHDTRVEMLEPVIDRSDGSQDAPEEDVDENQELQMDTLKPGAWKKQTVLSAECRPVQRSYRTFGGSYIVQYQIIYIYIMISQHLYIHI